MRVSFHDHGMAMSSSMSPGAIWRDVGATWHQLVHVLRDVVKHLAGRPGGLDAMPPDRPGAVPMLEPDDRGIRIRRIIAALLDTRDQGRFRCFEPAGDERHCHL